MCHTKRLCVMLCDIRRSYRKRLALCCDPYFPSAPFRHRVVAAAEGAVSMAGGLLQLNGIALQMAGLRDITSRCVVGVHA